MTDRLVLFDIDGTLLLTDGAGRESLAEAFESLFGLSDMDGVSRRVEYHGRTDPLIIENLAREAGLDLERLRSNADRLFRRYIECLERRLASGGRAEALPGAPELVEALAGESGVTLGLVTGNIERGARAKLRSVRLDHRFSTGGFGSDHASRREIARIAREKVERRHGRTYRQQDVVVIGDTRHDVDCARANGFRAVAFATGNVDVETLARAGADAVLPDLRDTREVLRALHGA